MDGVSAGRVDRNVAEGAQPLLRLHRGAELVSSPHSEKKLAEQRDLTRIQRAEATSDHPEQGAAKKQPPGDELKALSEGLNRALSKATGVRFQLGEDSGELVVQVVDLQSEEVIRSIPSDRTAELRRQIQEFRGSGVLLDRQA